MPLEIELKAWVDDPQALKDAINQFCRFQGEFDRTDGYWFPARAAAPGLSRPPPAGVRLRQERAKDAQGRTAQSALVAYKIKEVRDGLEVNHEREFTVSDAGAFASFLAFLGLEPGIGKQKQGWSWNHEGVTLELSHVASLGWFAELEILLEDSGPPPPETIAAARSRLLSLLKRLGIGEDKIEGRHYTELLQHGGTGISTA
jgi:adenylate cyclase class 2